MMPNWPKIVKEEQETKDPELMKLIYSEKIKREELFSCRKLVKEIDS